MATQQDLQELLRLQTARKMPIKDAMGQIKALQSVSLRRSVAAIFTFSQPSETRMSSAGH